MCHCGEKELVSVKCADPEVFMQEKQARERE